MPCRDLSLAEQENVRVWLRSLRTRFGNWRAVERALPMAHSVRANLMSGHREMGVTIAFRAAKVLDASIYDVIAGTALPPDTCKHCGKQASEHLRCGGESARRSSVLDAGKIDDAIARGPLADHIDEIFHTPSELFGKPHLVAAPVPSACATFTQDVDVPEHISLERLVALATDATTPRDIVALALETSEAAS